LSKWKDYRLDEIGEIVGGGTPASKVDAYWGNGIGWITPADLSDYKFKFISNGSRDITELGLKKSSAKLHPKNTVLMTSRAPIGYLAIADRPLATNQGFQSIRCNEEISDYNFVYYLLIAHKDGLASIASGATFPEVSGQKVKQYKVKIPDLPTQQKIAKILSNYDDLIEKNLGRINLLEEFAKVTYEQWFLHFKIDGKKLDIDSTTGLPFEWEWKPFQNLIDFKEGPGLRNWQYRKSGIPFLNIRVIKDGDVDMTKIQYLDIDEVKEKYEHFLLKENDHVISSSGTLGRLTTIRSCHLPLCLNTSIIRMRKKSDSFGTWLIKHMLQGQVFQNIMETYANGAAQVNFGPTHLKQIKLPCPSKNLAIKYEYIMDPIEEKIKILRDQNHLLNEARDILLPRLIEGIVDIDELDIAL
jgi:type I restriction enzyme, S subunit